MRISPLTVHNQQIPSINFVALTIRKCHGRHLAVKNFCIVYKSVPVQYSSCSLKQPIIIQSRRLIYMLSTLTLPCVAERQTLMSCDIQNLITMILVCHFFFNFSQISSLKLQVAQLSNSQCLILLYIITELTLHATADSNLLRPVSETQYVIILGLTKTVQQESFPGSIRVLFVSGTA